MKTTLALTMPSVFFLALYLALNWQALTTYEPAPVALAPFPTEEEQSVRFASMLCAEWSHAAPQACAELATNPTDSTAAAVLHLLD